MANPLVSLWRTFGASSHQAPATVAKSDTKAYAAGFMPGRSTTLREDILGQPHDSDYDLLYRIYDINADVSGAVDQWISVATGNDWQIRLDPKYLKLGEEIDDETQELINRVQTWLENPNPDKKLKFDELIAETIIDLAVCGDAYWEVVRDKHGVPIEITNIHPSTMRVVADEYGVIAGYIQRKDGKVVARWEPKQILHFRLPSRKSDFYGQSPLERAMEEITQDVKAMIANKSLLDNGFNPGAVLLMENSTENEENVQRIKTQIQQGHQGTNRWHRLLAFAGVKSLEPWGNTLKDMQFTDLRDLATTKIATAFGVPKLFLNLKESGDFATSDVMERQLYKNKGKQLQRILNGMITEDLIQAFDERLQFELNPPDFSDTDAMRRDALDLYKTDKLAISINELRTKHFALPEIDEGELERKREEARTQFETTQTNEEETDEPDTEPDDVKTDEAKKSLVHKADDDIDPLADERDREQAQLEKAMVDPLREFFTQQEADYRGRLPEDLTESSLDGYLAAGAIAFDAAFALLLGSLVFTPLQAGLRTAKDQLLATAGLTDDMRLRIDMSLRFDQTNPVVTEYVQRQAFAHVQGINATTRQHLRVALAEGIRNGEGSPELSDRVAEVFTKARDWRTDMIARTETAQAYQYGNHAAGELLYKEGLVAYRRWLTAKDERVCPICRPLNRYTIRFDAKYPDDLEPTHAHIQCRCTEVFLIGDEQDLEDWRRR